MRLFWYGIYIIIVVARYLSMPLRNLPRFIHNIFSRDKREYWHPMKYFREELDLTEKFYHDKN